MISYILEGRICARQSATFPWWEVWEAGGLGLGRQTRAIPWLRPTDVERMLAQLLGLPCLPELSFGKRLSESPLSRSSGLGYLPDQASFFPDPSGRERERESMQNISEPQPLPAIK